MSRGFRRILIAVRDVKRVPRAMIRKAATLARAADAHVELFHVISEPVPLESVRGKSAGTRDLEDDRATIAIKRQAQLERLTADPLFRGLRVRAHADWDYPAHESIIRRALLTRADLVIAGVQPAQRGGRLLLRNTDWELIRHCPVPVLLMRSMRNYRRPVILAAVDPLHSHAKPAELDTELLRRGLELAKLLRGELHLVHAYLPKMVLMPMALAAPVPIWVPPEVAEIEAQQIWSAVDRLAERAGIPKRRRHLRAGDVRTQLAAATKQLGAQIIVMGAVSRSALKRAFIGSTAERVLDDLSCDVLIVKPPGFKTEIA